MTDVNPPPPPKGLSGSPTHGPAARPNHMGATKTRSLKPAGVADLKRALSLASPRLTLFESATPTGLGGAQG